MDPVLDGLTILQSLPFAAYIIDTEGRITGFNERAVALWGVRPGAEARFSGAWRLHLPDGTPLDREATPAAKLLRDGAENRLFEAVAERPDGGRVPFRWHATLLHDKAGGVAGVINVLAERSDDDATDLKAQRLAAIVASSDDAIISKTLDGVVTSWNVAATRIFGYATEEMIGQPILKLIPEELHHEEAEILAALRRGEHLDHFDTVRIAKNGRRIDISLTISPIRDRFGTVVGASKIARDIGDRRRSEALQKLLFDELNHRVKNTLAMIQAIASQSLERTADPREFVVSFTGRVQALARAHDLIVQRLMEGAELIDLVQAQVMLGADADRIACSGPRVMLDPRSAEQLALVLHELATNARKYGALSVPAGHLAISWHLKPEPTPEIHLDWIESGVRGLTAPATRGFGTTLIERTLEANGGTAVVRFQSEGLSCSIRLPVRETDEAVPAPRKAGGEAVAHAGPAVADLRGKRVLVIEDEPLIALEIEAQLEAIGCIVVGPAATADRARQLIAEAVFDAALVDANLRGSSVEDLVTEITRRGKRFAFATGYGREALPAAFRDALMLSKPFHDEQLAAMIARLVAGSEAVPASLSRQ